MIQINIKIHVNYTYFHVLNQSLDSIEDILVISINDGRDVFVTLNGTWQSSCFGFSLTESCQFTHPIRSYTTKDILKIKNIPKNQHGTLSKVLSSSELDLTENLSHSLSIPKEVWRLTDYLLRCTSISRLVDTDEEIMVQIRECLDTGNSFQDIFKVSRVFQFQKIKKSLSRSSIERFYCSDECIDSLDSDLIASCMIQTLIDYIQFSSEPLIPMSLHRFCYPEQFEKFVQRLEPTHYNCFMHLIAFFRHIQLIEKETQKESLDIIQRKFIPSIFKVSKQSIDSTHKHLLVFVKYVQNKNP